MEQIVVTINQGFFLFCCVEQYNINSPQQSLSTKSNYFLRYTYPDGTTADASAQLSSANQLTSQSPEHDHSCTVHARLYTSGDHAQTVAEFSLDLVSPVEYLYRKFSANEFEMSDKISSKMSSALLAMSLSYYYVMGDHVGKESRRTDDILSTMLNWSSDNSYTNLIEDQRKGSSTDEDVALFAQHYKLQKTLRYLSANKSVGELPVHLPKSLLPPVQDISQKRPAIIPRTRSNTLPAGSKDHPVASARKASHSSSSEYSPLQPVETDPQEGYMYMEKEDKYGINNDVPDNAASDEEEYFLVDSPISPKDKLPTKNKKSMLCKEPITDKSSSSSMQFSPATNLPRLPVGDFIPDEVYELCDLTPAELAGVEILKKRGPRPKPPVAPYRGSQTIDKAGEYGRLREEHFKSSLEESLKCSLKWMSLKENEREPPALGPKPPALGPKPSVKQKPPITSPKPVRQLKPPPRKKHNIINKTKAEQPP